MSFSMHDIYALVTSESRSGRTPRAVAARLGVDESDPKFQAVVSSMRVSGFLRTTLLGALAPGPSPLPAPRSAVRHRPGVPGPAGRPPVGDDRTICVYPDAQVPPEVVAGLGGGRNRQVQVPRRGYSPAFDKAVCPLCGTTGAEHQWLIRNEQGQTVRCSVVDAGLAPSGVPPAGSVSDADVDVEPDATQVPFGPSGVPPTGSLAPGPGLDVAGIGWRPPPLPEDVPIQRGQPPLMSYQPWTTVQRLDLGATGTRQHYWRCTIDRCPCWAGPYSTLSQAKGDGLDHVSGPAHRSVDRENP